MRVNRYNLHQLKGHQIHPSFCSSRIDRHTILTALQQTECECSLSSSPASTPVLTYCLLMRFESLSDKLQQRRYNVLL